MGGEIGCILLVVQKRGQQAAELATQAVLPIMGGQWACYKISTGAKYPATLSAGGYDVKNACKHDICILA